MDFRDRIHHLLDLLSDLLEEDVFLAWKRNWPGLVMIYCIIVLTGPLLVLAYKIQRWNVRSPWDTEDHWVGTKQFAVTFIGYDLFLLFAFLHFQTELSTFWFPTPWSWFFFHLIIWYVCFTLLSPTLALFFEHIDPQTRSLERMLLPNEQPLPPSKKRKKGRAVPLGQLLLDEREAQRRQAGQINYRQPPLLLDETGAPTVPISSPIPDTSQPSCESKPTSKPERHKPESLDHLF